jgi:aryl-alcohol dehydrogenase-like predicted oxidoreductase
MTIDSIIAIKKIESIMDKYKDSMDWLQENHSTRKDLITSLEESIDRLNIIRVDIIMYDTKIEAKEWMES